MACLTPAKGPGWKVLDVAGGTGDVAFRIVEASHGHAHATVLDINGSMLAVGRDRAEKKGLSENTDFVEANAEELPFADNTFDAYTIAFGIRNVPRIDVALTEAYRVLKPGGRAAFIASGPQAPKPDRGDVVALRPNVGRDRPHLERIVALVAQGAVRPPEVTRYRLSEAVAAHRLSESRHFRGKLIFLVR